MGFSIPNQRRIIAAMMPPMVTGRFYHSPFGTGPTGTNLQSLRYVYVTPFYVPNVEGVTATSLNTEVTGAGAGGSVFRMGIYTDQNGNPGIRLVDSGNIAQDSTGAKQATFTQFLRQGWYWLAIANSANATFRGLTYSLACAQLGWGDNEDTSSNYAGKEPGSGDVTAKGLPATYMADYTSSTLPLNTGPMSRILVGV